MSRAARFLSWVDEYTLWAFNPPLVRPDLPRTPGHPVWYDAADDVGARIGRMLATGRQRMLDLGDPVLALRNSERLRRHLVPCLEELQAEGPRAVRILRRRGWSFPQIAGETGLSSRHVAEFARASHSLDPECITLNLTTDPGLRAASQHLQNRERDGSQSSRHSV